MGKHGMPYELACCCIGHTVLVQEGRRKVSNVGTVPIYPLYRYCFRILSMRPLIPRQRTMIEKNHNTLLKAQSDCSLKVSIAFECSNVPIYLKPIMKDKLNKEFQISWLEQNIRCLCTWIQYN